MHLKKSFSHRKVNWSEVLNCQRCADTIAFSCFRAERLSAESERAVRWLLAFCWPWQCVTYITMQIYPKKERKKSTGWAEGQQGDNSEDHTNADNMAVMPDHMHECQAMATAPSWAACTLSLAPSLSHSLIPALPLPFYALGCPFWKEKKNWTTSSQQVQATDARKYLPSKCHFFLLDCQSFASALVSSHFILQEKVEHGGQKCKFFFFFLGGLLCVFYWLLSQCCV